MTIDPTELHDPEAYEGPALDENGASRDGESLRLIARALAKRRAAAADRARDTWSAKDGWAWKTKRGHDDGDEPGATGASPLEAARSGAARWSDGDDESR